MGKYGVLWEYVKNNGSQSFKLSFEEIQNIAGIPIDHSFLKYKKELTEYGYQVGKISIKEQTVIFNKMSWQISICRADKKQKQGGGDRHWLSRRPVCYRSISCFLRVCCSRCSCRKYRKRSFWFSPLLSLPLSMQDTAESLHHILAFSLLFQSVLSTVWHFHCFLFRLSTFCCPAFLSMRGARSPFSSRT